MLLVDDIQFLESKERTQEEFFHTFNALHQAQKQIVITSDRPPKADRARWRSACAPASRWGWSPTSSRRSWRPASRSCAEAPSRTACTVPADVLELIAGRIPATSASWRARSSASPPHASINQHAITLPMAQVAIAELFPGRPAHADPRRDDPRRRPATYYGFSVDELCSPAARRQLVTARQIAMYLTRELTDLSLPRIGEAFGGRDHTTVMHANNKITR